jgi:hypothetical protein
MVNVIQVNPYVEDHHHDLNSPYGVLLEFKDLFLLLLLMLINFGKYVLLNFVLHYFSYFYVYFYLNLSNNSNFHPQ